MITRHITIKLNLSDYDKSEQQAELVLILRKLADKIEGGESPKSILSSDGTVIGIMRYERTGI